MSKTLLIVDDEQPARERLQRLLGDLEEAPAKVVAAANGEEALKVCQTQLVDIVLLDIRMPGMDGIEAASYLQALPEAPAIIFTTAYDQYAIDAFETEAIGYLLKPVRKARLEAALAKASRLSKRSLNEIAKTQPNERQFVSTRVGEEVRLIRVDDIVYFEADQKYVKAVLSSGAELIDDSLKSLEQVLADRFIRIHRKLLVALNSIEALEKTTSGGSALRLRGMDKSLPVSRRHVGQVKAKLSEYG
ncbi:MAG: LytTR family DNA-binding domain-containing protein [Pseudomonadota bacterium]